MMILFAVLLPLACVESEVSSLAADDPAGTVGTPDTGAATETVPGVEETEPEPVLTPLLINEICPANREILVDEQGDSPDFIELINPYDIPFSLDGFGLSDDPDDPFLLTLPDITLAPGEIRLVFAKGADDTDGLGVDDKRLYAPFKLDALGEVVILTGPDGRVHDQVETPRLYFDQSLGRSVDDLAWLVYLEPTPGLANATEGRPGFAETPTFTPDGGFFSGSVSVEIHTQSETATVHYVRTAWTPTEADTVYSVPLEVSGTEASVVRAIAVDEGLWPSRVATRTLFLDREIDLPVWSITSEPGDLFGADAGIMSMKNIWENWEVDTHLELYEADGTLILASDAGLKLHGGASRSFDQKGLRLLYRTGYGTAPLEHDLFPGNDVAEFDRLILRNAGHDDGLAELRDPLSHELMKDLDVDVQGWRPAIVYLNGDYWGLYHTREKQDRYYVEDHHGADPDDLDFLEYNGSIINEGDSQDYQDLFTYVLTGNLADPAVYAPIPDWIDVDEYILYTIIEVFSGNYDWPGNNIQFWRPRADDGRWRWTLYDTESGWNNWIGPDYNSIAHATTPDAAWWPYPQWSTTLLRGLLEAPEFRDKFINAYADLLNTRFQPDESLPVFDAMADEIAREIALDRERWGGDLVGWIGQINAVRTFLEERPDHVRSHIISEFGLAGTWDLSLDVDPPSAGRVVLEAIAVDAPYEGIYFRGVPVTLTAEPAEGWVFTGWSDAAFGSEPTLLLDPAGNRALVAEFELAL